MVEKSAVYTVIPLPEDLQSGSVERNIRNVLRPVFVETAVDTATEEVSFPEERLSRLGYFRAKTVSDLVDMFELEARAKLITIPARSPEKKRNMQEMLLAINALQRRMAALAALPASDDPKGPHKRAG